MRNDSLAGVVVADKEYPSRVAFTLLGKVCLNIFSSFIYFLENMKISLDIG